ncbi:cytochrome P450 [Rippkaea orientalis PCC 8801]|uniref:Cytochrome P450 n=1 Tax=Rippkaea orientalis (strain PCC 8801 / RF-1) TaxID=41431 RepID=B7K247_RIPO1|nr:cytochrome P450 [Rippkaea orientalis]ACK65183.1 cytochrome P450 [Rippkaea orientalis PCC 8801]
MKSIPQSEKPLLLQRLQWIFDPVTHLENTHAECPDIFYSQVMGVEGSVIVSHPQAIQQILTNDRKQFSSPSQYNQLLQPLVGDNSTIMIDGDRHRKRRQLVMPSFHGERLKTYGELTVRITKEVLNQLPTGQPFLGRPTMQSISLKVIMEAVFGITQGERYEKLQRLLGQLTDLFESPVTSALLFFPSLQKDWGSWSPWGKFLRQRQQIDELIYAEISDRRSHQDPNRTDILSLLIEARDEAGEPLSDQELRDELMTLLIAGHETTATAMTWGLYWLHRTPEVKEKLYQELTSLGESPDAMEIFRLPYLTAVCNETLRISPVTMLTFPRVAEEPIELLGYKIEPGTLIMGCMYLTMQREDLYPNPREFRPERFLERQYSPYEFLPFGGGVRRCLGEALAQFEMKLVLATIIANYQLKLAEKQPEKLQRRGFTLAASRGVKLIKLGLLSNNKVVHNDEQQPIRDRLQSVDAIAN